MRESYKDILEILGIKEQDDTDLLTEKFENIKCISRKNEKQEAGLEEETDIAYWNRKYVQLIKWYNIKKISPIYDPNRELLALNTLNEDANYKGISRDLKERFTKYHFCYNNGEYYFDNNGSIWKTRLFSTLGIEFDIYYLNDKEKKNLNLFRQICFVKEKDKEESVNELFLKICQISSKEVGDFHVARCRMALLKKLDQEENIEQIYQAYPFAKVSEEGIKWIIDMPVFIETEYLKELEEIEEKTRKLKKQVEDTNSPIYDMIEKKYVSDNKRMIYAEIYACNENVVTLEEILGLGLEKKLQYKLKTKFPKTEYAPVYFALFRSINNNLFFRQPGEKYNVKRLRKFYEEYYEFLALRIGKTNVEENYWLSEKLFGINFLNYLVVKLNELHLTHPDKYSFNKYWFKNETTKSLVDLIDILIEIDEPELRILYLDIFVDSKVNPQKCIDYMEAINVEGIENNYYEIKDVIKINDSKKRKSQGRKKKGSMEEILDNWDEIEKEIKKSIQILEENGASDKIDKFREIMKKPDTEFLNKKEYRKILKFICENTEWLSKFIIEGRYEKMNVIGGFINEKIVFSN